MKTNSVVWMKINWKYMINISTIFVWRLSSITVTVIKILLTVSFTTLPNILNSVVIYLRRRKQADIDHEQMCILD